jgi:hypothetical protein
MTETICVPKEEFKIMKEELRTLRETQICKRLLEFEQNISKGKKFTRADLGF